MMTIPKPMENPCDRCEKHQACASAETYKCPLFQQVFVQSWNETVSHLRRLLLDREEAR